MSVTAASLSLPALTVLAILDLILSAHGLPCQLTLLSYIYGLVIIHIRVIWDNLSLTLFLSVIYDGSNWMKLYLPQSSIN